MFSLAAGDHSIRLMQTRDQIATANICNSNRPVLNRSSTFDLVSIAYRSCLIRVSFLAAVVILLALSLSNSSAFAASSSFPNRPSVVNPIADEPGRAKRVLMISTGSRFSIGFPTLEQNAVEKLRQMYSGQLDFYSEYLDIIRFPSEKHHRIFSDYLHDKYAGDVPDLSFFFTRVICVLHKKRSMRFFQPLPWLSRA